MDGQQQLTPDSMAHTARRQLERLAGRPSGYRPTSLGVPGGTTGSFNRQSRRNVPTSRRTCSLVFSDDRSMAIRTSWRSSSVPPVRYPVRLGSNFSFCHVDGGHSAVDAYADIALCHALLLPGGHLTDFWGTPIPVLLGSLTPLCDPGRTAHLKVRVVNEAAERCHGVNNASPHNARRYKLDLDIV
jgi:hypothetical protein